jgi:hypothetical protein
MRNDQKERMAKLSARYALPMSMATGSMPADQLEGFLISELARDSFEAAIKYVRSMPEDTLKLTCLVQIAQALRQPNY